jgi:adenylylsulfate reductase subunit A
LPDGLAAASQAIVPDTHRFADPTGARTARFSRHRREGISYPLAEEAFQDPHKEVVGWENFLGMTIGQAVVWASQNIDPKEVHPELTTSEPYVMGSHATCSGAWASGRKITRPPSTHGATTA